MLRKHVLRLYGFIKWPCNTSAKLCTVCKCGASWHHNYVEISARLPMKLFCDFCSREEFPFITAFVFFYFLKSSIHKPTLEDKKRWSYVSFTASSINILQYKDTHSHTCCKNMKGCTHYWRASRRWEQGTQAGCSADRGSLFHWRWHSPQQERAAWQTETEVHPTIPFFLQTWLKYLMYFFLSSYLQMVHTKQAGW